MKNQLWAGLLQNIFAVLRIMMVDKRSAPARVLLFFLMIDPAKKLFCSYDKFLLNN